MERIYLDTSVFGGYFEPEFALWTRMLFDKIQSRAFGVIFSEVLESELQKAPVRVRNLINLIPNETSEFVSVSDGAIHLAKKYILEEVVGKTSFADCLHIAIASVQNADLLVSWNFKHIVNFRRIRGYNAVNHGMGYKILDIRTPREILEYE